MSNNRQTEFKTIPVKSFFELDGNMWFKKSKTTANIYGRPLQWCFFKQSEKVLKID